MKYTDRNELIRAILDYGLVCFRLGQVPADNPKRYEELDKKQDEAWHKVYALISLINETC